MTNRERINNLSDEEFAKFLTDFHVGRAVDYLCTACKAKNGFNAPCYLNEDDDYSCSNDTDLEEVIAYLQGEVLTDRDYEKAEFIRKTMIAKHKAEGKY